MFPAKLRRAAYHSDDEQQHPQQHEQVIDNPLSQWGEPLPAWKTLGPGPHPASAQHTGAQTWHGSTTTSALSPYQLHLSRYYKPVPRRRTPWHVVQTWVREITLSDLTPRLQLVAFPSQPKCRAPARTVSAQPSDDGPSATRGRHPSEPPLRARVSNPRRPTITRTWQQGYVYSSSLW